MEYFSFSQLRTYEECPMLYYYRYILKMPEPKNLALLFGSSIHSALEYYYRNGKEDKAIDVFIDKFSDSKDVKLKRGEDLAKEGRMGVKMLNEYFKPENKPYFKAKEVEFKFQTILKNPITGKELGIPIKGVMDLITEDDLIVDHKTSSGMWTEQKIDDDLQKVFYHLAYKSIFGKDPLGFVFNFLIKRTGTPRFDTQMVEVSTGQMFYCLEYIEHIVKEIKNERFGKKLGTNCRYCTHRLMCI